MLRPGEGPDGVLMRERCVGTVWRAADQRQDEHGCAHSCARDFKSRDFKKGFRRPGRGLYMAEMRCLPNGWLLRIQDGTVEDEIEASR